MNLKLPFGWVYLPLDLPPGLLEFSELESISMNLKLLFGGADLLLDLPELSRVVIYQ